LVVKETTHRLLPAKINATPEAVGPVFGRLTGDVGQQAAVVDYRQVAVRRDQRLSLWNPVNQCLQQEAEKPPPRPPLLLFKLDLRNIENIDPT